MKKLEFTKMVGSGNDFVVIKNQSYSNARLKKIAVGICDRKFGAGSDGLLVIAKSRIADFKMRIFNSDGSEAEMCGNGVRCAALFWQAAKRGPQSASLKIETKAGIIRAQVNQNTVKVKLSAPKEIKLDFRLKLAGKELRVNFINSGVAHTVIFAAGLDKIDVDNLGRRIRYHKAFSPRGANVNFVEILNKDTIKIRTYERGVEAETLACGTGSAAAALIFALKGNIPSPVNVVTKSGETLKISFDKLKNNFENVWLEGSAKIVYQGVIN